MGGWKYYNHAAIPTCAPHEVPDLAPVMDGIIWKDCDGKKTFFARWTTDFDCGVETDWWYVIKDTPFDLMEIKAKRRYEINKGNKHFDVQRLENPMVYAEELCNVQEEAFSAYPNKYRPTVDREKFKDTVAEWNKCDCYVYGAFSRKNNRLCGYAFLKKEEGILHFNVLKTCPESEKNAVNAAIVYKILQDFNAYLGSEFYICDGARNIVHETHFQEYLEKYFGFRKAYCNLHLKYNPKLEWLFLSLYRFRKIMKKFDSIGLIHKINAVFNMHEITRR